MLGVIVRWTLFAAVLVTTGAAAFRFLVLPRAARDPLTKGLAGRVASRVAAVASLAAAIGLLAAASRLPIQVAQLRDETLPLLPQVQALGLRTMWGAVWIYQVAALLAAGVAFAAARGGGRGAWRLAALFSVMAAVSPALSGHALGSERLVAVAVIADSMHVLAGGAWLGAMVALLIGLGLAHDQGDAGSALAASMVTAFSRVALIGASITLMTGLFASWLHLGELSALWQSRYGKALILKLMAVMAMAAAGAWNWRKAGPKLRKTGQVMPMRRAVRLEVAIGAAIILATALLVAIPQPGQE